MAAEPATSDSLFTLHRRHLYHSSIVRAMSPAGTSGPVDSLSYLCRSSKEVEQIGNKLSSILTTGDVLFLQGDLGAGKTTLSRGIVRSKFNDKHMVVTSPSYLLDNTYQYGKDEYMHHMDLYRLPVGYAEMGILGIPTIFSNALCIVEWPNRLVGSNIPESYLDVAISIPPLGTGDAWAKQGVASGLTQPTTSVASGVNDGDVLHSDDSIEEETETEAETEDDDGSDAEENNTRETRVITFHMVGERWRRKADVLRRALGEPMTAI